MRFIFVDRILEMVPGETICALKKIDPNEDFFKDHFPGFPVVPGVLLTEMMAQTAGKCLDAEKKPRGKAMLAQIKSASFRDWVKPGKDAYIFGKIMKNRDNYAVADCFIKVKEKKICNAELFFTFVPLEAFGADFTDDVLESYLSSRVDGRYRDCNGSMVDLFSLKGNVYW